MLPENELKKLQAFESSFFVGQSYLNNDGAQLYLIFQPIRKTITTFSGLPDTFSKWESNGLSNEKLKLSHTTNESLSPKLVWMNNSRIRSEFKGSCLKQEDKAVYTPKNMVVYFIVYELDSRPWDLDTDFNLGDFLFGGVKLTKNPNPNKYPYSS